MCKQLIKANNTRHVPKPFTISIGTTDAGRLANRSVKIDKFTSLDGWACMLIRPSTSLSKVKCNLSRLFMCFVQAPLKHLKLKIMQRKGFIDWIGTLLELRRNGKLDKVGEKPEGRKTSASIESDLNQLR